MSIELLCHLPKVAVTLKETAKPRFHAQVYVAPWLGLLQLTHWGQNTLHSRRTRLNPKWLEVLAPPIKKESQMRNHRCRLWKAP